MVDIWRVVVVRPPAEAPIQASQTRRSPQAPVVAADAVSLEVAERLAAELRETGAVVAVLEAIGSGAWCVDHATGLAAYTCSRCQRPICAECRATAHALLCARCSTLTRHRARISRLRQLFVVFLFAVFLLEVARWQTTEEEALKLPATVAIYQFVPPGLTGHPLVQKLNTAEAGSGRSLRDLQPWFAGQYRRYTGAAVDPLTVSLRGPWERHLDPPPVPDEAPNAVAAMWRAWRYPRWFHGLAREMGGDPDQQGIRVYMMYGADDDDLASHSRGSRRGRVAVVWVSLAETNPAYAVETVAHEITHVLGADDRFDDERFLAKFPEGYADPFADPLYPQHQAELMAVDIPRSRTLEREIDSLAQVQIGHRTAAEIGFISAEQADAWYTPLPASASRPAVEADVRDRVLAVGSALGAEAAMSLASPQFGGAGSLGLRAGGEPHVLKAVVGAGPYAK